jgi:hypothetical protein
MGESLCRRCKSNMKGISLHPVQDVLCQCAGLPRAALYVFLEHVLPVIPEFIVLIRTANHVESPTGYRKLLGNYP